MRGERYGERVVAGDSRFGGPKHSYMSSLNACFLGRSRLQGICCGFFAGAINVMDEDECADWIIFGCAEKSRIIFGCDGRHPMYSFRRFAAKKIHENVSQRIIL